jgi:hypothetical protein
LSACEGIILYNQHLAATKRQKAFLTRAKTLFDPPHFKTLISWFPEKKRYPIPAVGMASFGHASQSA